MGRTKQIARKTFVPSKKAAKIVKTEPTSQGMKVKTRKTPKKGAEHRAERVKKRAKAGVNALKEIRAYQKTTELLIPRAPFARLIKEVLRACGPDISKIRPEAVTALQEAAEAYLVGLFEDTNAATIHAGHVTIGVKDLSLAQRLRGENQ